MFDPEESRYTKSEERPPWELSPGGRFREWFSCRSIDQEDEQYCREVEEQKQARVHAQAQRARRQQQRQAERQAQMDAQQAQREARFRQPEAEEADGAPPDPPQDPRAARYDYSNAYAPDAKQRRRSNRLVLGVVIGLLTLCLVIGVTSAIQRIFSEAEDAYSAYSVLPELPDTDEDDAEEAEAIPFSGSDGEESSEAAEEASDSSAELERAELDGTLTVDIQSSKGKTPLTYQELYAKCLPSTVSITVVTDSGVGTGTGIVITEDGYILTCNHVIEDATACRVTTFSDETYSALLVGGDAQTDLAVLKIEAEGLTAAEFGDSDELTVGDEALAIGDPLGTELRGTLTNGIISAINRNVTVNNYSMTLLQTTAALNSGNSGGPLLNIYGQVVGVNNMKMNSTVVTVEGLGFAVPTSVVREIVPILSSDGKVSRPVLGITCYGIDEETKEQNGEPVTGLCVASVNEQSDAYTQGLQVGDYITAVNGVPVVSVAEVKEVIADLAIGDTVTLDIYRVDEETGEASEFTLTVALVDQSAIS